MKKNAEVQVIKSEIEPEPTAVIAASIIKISDGFEKLLNGGLSRRALIVLLKDQTGVPQHQIDRILDALPALKAAFTTAGKRKTK